MLRMMVGQLRQQLPRTVTLLVGVLVATTGFTLLTGAVDTSRLEVMGTVSHNFRAAYDILVRPAGSRNGIEMASGQVRPNFLSGQFGGITMAQYSQVAGLPGVDVAAPVAMVGYVRVFSAARVDATDQVDESADRQLLRIQRTWSTDRGLSSIDDAGDVYVYLTTNPVLWPDSATTKADPLWNHLYHQGDKVFPVDRTACGKDAMPPAELMPDGHARAICRLDEIAYGQDALSDDLRDKLVVVQRRPDGRYTTFVD